VASVSVTVTNIVQGSDAITKEAKALEDLGKAGKSAAPGVESATKSVGGLESVIGKLAAGGLLLAAGKQLLDFGKASLNAASDVQEMSSKFDTVFKDLAGGVTAELQAFADASNRSIFDLKGFAATLQDTFVPLGFARDSAADMSIELVKLAEDLASFNNLNTADVVTDLQSALVGNTETLRKYGVVATQAAIDEKALAMGFEFTKGHMDAQTKAATILQIALDSTTDAQGDAIKTADSYANMSKGLEAAMMDLKVAIGNEMLPAATQAVAMFTALAKGATEAVGTISGLADQTSTIGDLLQGKVNTGFQELAGWLASDNIAAKALRLSMGETAEAFIANQNALQNQSEELQQNALLTREAEARQAALSAQYDESYIATERVSEVTDEMRIAFARQNDAAAAASRILLEHGVSLSMTTREMEELAYATGEMPGHEEQMAAVIEEANEKLRQQEEAARLASEAFDWLGGRIASVRGPISDLIAAQEELATSSGTAAEEAQARIVTANAAISESYRQTAMDILNSKLATVYGEDALGAQLAAIQQQEAFGLISKAEAEALEDVAIKSDRVREVTGSMLVTVTDTLATDTP